MSKVVGAYLHCKPDGTPFYVGKGTIKRSRDLYTTRNKWHKRITNKYGRNNIRIEFMECSTEKFALELEAGLIKTLRRNGFVLCNIAPGGIGNSGWKIDREVVERIADKNRGRVQSAEERAMRSARLKGIKKSIPMSDEHRRKIGLSAKGKRWYNNGQNVVFCHEGMQPEGYTLGRSNITLCKEK
jgi:hypothetical protein